jgi:hypothetical protein
MKTFLLLLLPLAACLPGATSTTLVPFDAPTAETAERGAATSTASATASGVGQEADRRAAPEAPPATETRDDEEATEDSGLPADEGASGSRGTYRGYFCPEQLFIETLDISRDDALANCERNAAYNPHQSVRCTWNGEEILRREVMPGDCDGGVTEPAPDGSSGDDAHACWSTCVDAAWPGLIACLDGGGEQAACQDAFYADVYACAEGCDGSPADGTDGAPPADGHGDTPAGPTDPDAPSCLPEGFAPSAFDVPQDAMSCDGARSVRYDARQGLWVGIVACAPGTWRFYLSDGADGPFLPAMDVAGHGQDHCELVDPGFTLGNEDDITSGSCPTCAIGWNLPLEGVAGWYRAFLGEQFQYVDATGPWSYQVSQVTCGCGG